ncbi:MAG: bifunctional diaminohydroxyphosphoribosylaminopyrimidine deaminase/5-amino-6-(5-phosphoribosylamino)uracil reductase RibD, partial [Gemmatimonadota bacterium]
EGRTDPSQSPFVEPGGWAPVDVPELGTGERALLDRALHLGRRGWGRVHPNPLVGCVLERDGQVIGEGWHREFGGAHAEVDALATATGSTEGATAYVSLEPCDHFGKTPPCTRALQEAGIARVVYGAPDPGEVSGGGGRKLAEAGVRITGPVLSLPEARAENPTLFPRAPERPWVDLKLAISLDGGIAEAPGSRTAISGAEALAEVHRFRAGFDAIVVGARTARIDNPLLTARGEVVPRVPPIRIVVDGRGTLPLDARMLDEGEGGVRVLTTLASPGEWRDELASRGATVEVVEGAEGRVHLGAALQGLRKAGMRRILCEGGGVLGSALLDADLVDRLHLLVAPHFLGAELVPAFPGIQAQEGGRWRPIREPARLGSDFWISMDRED